MNPDRRFAVHVESNRQVAEALTEAADVLLVAHRLVKEVRRDKHEHKQRQEAVGEIHLTIETVVRPFLTTIYEKRSISGRFDPSQGRSLRYGVFVLAGFGSGAKERTHGSSSRYQWFGRIRAHLTRRGVWGK